DQRRGGGLFELLQRFDEYRDFHARQISDVVTVDLALQDFLTQTRSVAQMTWTHRHVRLDHLLSPLGLGLQVALDVFVRKAGDNALKGHVEVFCTDLGLDLYRSAV